MAVNDLPLPIDTTVDFRGIPAREHAFGSVRQFSIVDKVECQESDIAVPLNFGINHFVPRRSLPIQTCAKIAGALILLTFVAGGFGEAYVPSKLIVDTDAVATVENLNTSVVMFRLIFAGYLVELSSFSCPTTEEWLTCLPTDITPRKFQHRGTMLHANFAAIWRNQAKRGTNSRHLLSYRPSTASVAKKSRLDNGLIS